MALELVQPALHSQAAYASDVMPHEFAAATGFPMELGPDCWPNVALVSDPLSSANVSAAVHPRYIQRCSSPGHDVLVLGAVVQDLNPRSTPRVRAQWPPEPPSAFARS